MPSLRSIDSTFTTTALALVTIAETIILTSPNLQTPKDVSFIFLRAWAQLTLGTGTTAVTARLRRGAALTGAVVGPANPINGTAGNTQEFSIEFREERDFFDFVQYSFTLQQTAAAANGSALAGHLLIMSF